MSFRKETKFRVTVNEFYRIYEQLKLRGLNQLYNHRQVNSIYFDTENLSMFNDSEEGTLPRRKIRIRWYDDVMKYNLEQKISSIEGRYKKVTERYDRQISSGDLSDCKFFDNQYGLVRPQLKISYKRWYCQLDGLRITFDQNINYMALKGAMRPPHPDPECVIEVKTSTLVSDDDIAKLFPIPTSRFSKYCRGVMKTQT